MPQGLTDSAAGRIAGVSHTAIRKARLAGLLRTLDDGSVDPAGLEEWQAGRRPPRGGAKVQVTPPASVDGIAAENAQKALAMLEAEGVFATRPLADLHKTSYEARIRQIEYDQKSRSVFDVEARVKVAGEELARVRTRLLALPAEQAPSIHRCKTVAEVQDRLLLLITRILEELSEDVEDRPV